MHCYIEMRRKIIKQGHNTLTMTLPSEWVRKFNLKAGDEVDVGEKDNGLFVSTDKKDGKLKVEIDISGLDIPTIWKYFMSVYREGYDEILIKFSPSTQFENPYEFFSKNKLDIRYKREKEKKSCLEFFHDLVNRFIGLEIVDHGKDFVLIKELSEATSKEFDSSLRRVFLLVQGMAEETLEALKKNNPKILRHVHEVDINLDKFHDYCIRILNKVGNKDTRKTSLLFSTLYLLELTGDEFKNIAYHLINDFPKADFKHIIDIMDSIKEQIDLYYNLFYQFDKEKIKEISEIDQRRYFNVDKKYKITSIEEKEIFHHLRVVAIYINALTELRIEMEY